MSAASRLVVPLVGVVMGSISDWAVMEHATSVLNELLIPFETQIVSAHRMPIEMAEYAQAAEGRGLRAIVAGAGGAAHLPGMLAAHTLVPILGVPIASTALHGQDSLLSMVQMPAGIPVATFAIGRAGAINAALFAAAMIGATDPALLQRLAEKRKQAHDGAVASQAQLPHLLG